MFSQYNFFFLKASGAPKPSGARGLCPRWLHGCDAPDRRGGAGVGVSG